MMPIPRRNKDEDKTNFISRCMSNEVMKKDYPDEKQRVAICIGQATADCDCVEAADFERQLELFGYEEEITEDNLYIPSQAEYEDFGEETEEWDVSVAKPGLWENIRKKKEREGKNYKPAKRGDPDRPDPESWKKAQSDGGDEMAVEQIQKMHDQLMEIVMRLKDMSLSVEFQDWTKDMISKAEIYVQNVYDFVKYYEPGKYEDEYTSDKEVEEPSELETEEPEMEEGAYEYKDPKTGEIYTYNRRGYYEKDGTILIYIGKAEEYQGRKVTLNKPFRTSNGPKKFAVYVKNESGNVVIVRFGDPNMTIKKNIPERRKSFRARHNCDNPGPKWKARYWACKSW
jgi:hypothetical protein